MDSYETKKRRRFNFIDVVLLIVIIAILAAIVYSYFSPYAKQLFSTTYEIEYTLQVKGVRREFNNKIKEGDTVVETETIKDIGTVKSAVYSASKFVSTDSNGRTVISDYPGMYDVTVVVRAKAEIPAGLYSVNSYTVTAGKKIPFRVPDFIGEATCISVSEVEE